MLKEYLNPVWHSQLDIYYGTNTFKKINPLSNNPDVLDTKYGPSFAEKKRSQNEKQPTSAPTSTKKRRVTKPHEKIDTSKNTKITNFFQKKKPDA